MCFAVLHHTLRVLAEWSKYIRVSQRKTSGRDADHRVGFSVENNRTSNGIRASSIASLPQVVINDNHGCRTDPVVIGNEGAPSRDVNAQYRKQAGRNLEAVDILRVAGTAHST